MAPPYVCAPIVAPAPGTSPQRRCAVHGCRRAAPARGWPPEPREGASHGNDSPRAGRRAGEDGDDEGRRRPRLHGAADDRREADPGAGPGEIVVRIEASGLCHTDIHAAHGDWPVKPTLPLIPGHEGVGIVEQVGPGVKEVKEGDRVAIPWLGYACGAC